MMFGEVELPVKRKGREFKRLKYKSKTGVGASKVKDQAEASKVVDQSTLSANPADPPSVNEDLCVDQELEHNVNNERVKVSTEVVIRSTEDLLARPWTFPKNVDFLASELVNYLKKGAATHQQLMELQDMKASLTSKIVEADEKMLAATLKEEVALKSVQRGQCLGGAVEGRCVKTAT